jgi:hypothetical protein
MAGAPKGNSGKNTRLPDNLSMVPMPPRAALAGQKGAVPLASEPDVLATIINVIHCGGYVLYAAFLVYIFSCSLNTKIEASPRAKAWRARLLA